MPRFSILLLCVGLVAGQDSFRQKKCDFIRNEMRGGHKEWMKHQAWYQRLARLCNLPMHEEARPGMMAGMQRPMPMGMHGMQMPSVRIEVPEQLGGGLQNAIGWAKQAATSPAGAELKDDAKKLAETAKSAFQHQDSQELKEGAAEFMSNIKTLWEKNTDQETKKKAALLMSKAQQLLSGKAKEELKTGLKIAKAAEKQVLPQAEELLKNTDVAKKVFDELQKKSGFNREQAEALAALAKKNLEKYGGSVQV